MKQKIKINFRSVKCFPATGDRVYCLCRKKSVRRIIGGPSFPIFSHTICPMDILPIRPVDKSGGHYLWILMPAFKSLPPEFLFYATSFLSNIVQLGPIIYILSVDNIILINVEVLLNVVIIEAVLVVFEHFP